LASNNLIRSYKGHILDPIYKELKRLGLTKSKGEIELIMKEYTDIQKSSKDMTDEEIREHKEGCTFYAEQLGLNIDFEKEPRLDLDFNRTNKNN